MMTWIRKNFRIIKKWFNTHKKQWLVFLLLSGLFFSLKFPYNESIVYLIDKVKEYSQFSFSINYKSVYLNPLGPTLVFKEPEIRLETTDTILKVEQLSLYPSYKALLALQAGGGVTIQWIDSVLSLKVREKKINKDTTGLLVSIESERFNISHLGSFFPILSKVSGYIRIHADILIDPEFANSPQGSWSLSARNVHSRSLSYTFPGSIGTISLPAFRWSRIWSQGTIKDGEILITDTFMGEKTDPFQIKTRGIIGLNFFKQSFSNIPRIQINDYTLGLEIITHSSIKPKLYFLDIFFSSVEEKTTYGSHYLALLQGNRANIFNMSGISKLPTLEEIQQPPEPEF